MLTELFIRPSLWNLIFSTIVFAIAAKYIHQHLDGRGMPDGRKRTLLVLGIAALLSWGAGEAADWADATLEQAQAVDQQPNGLSQLITPTTLKSAIVNKD
jgi:hypothetical protein